MSRGESLVRRVRIAGLAAAAAVVLRLVASTWRIQEEGGDVLHAYVGSTRPLVMVLWHGEILPLIWSQRGRGLIPVVSTHGDGEIIARVMASLGYGAVRGSSSRGGARALLEGVRLLREGHILAFTTDGPRGPRRVSAPGAAAAAIRGGAPVVAMGAVSNRFWRLRSWDGMIIPKPFAQVTVRYSSAISSEGHDVTELTAVLDRALAQVCQPDDV